MKEIIRSRVKQTSLSLSRNRISAVRRKNIARTGCRLIENGKITIAGGLGKVNENELFARAREFLNEAVDYPVKPGCKAKSAIDLSGFKMNDTDLCDEIEYILAELQKRHGDFYISNKVNLSSIEYMIENELDLNLCYLDSYLTISFLLKEASSTGIMDTFFGVTERQLDAAKVIAATSEVINAFQNKVELDAYPMPVIIDQSTLTRLFLRDLNGKLVGNKASLFEGRFGERVFSERFNLGIAVDPVESFAPQFDAEGTLSECVPSTLIESGVLVRPYTDKRTAQQFGFANTGCAGGNYDSVPTLGTCRLEIAPSAKTLKQLLDGRNGILVAIAGGGDFTSEGQFASPVQVAYLTDGEKLLGRLPELTISGSVFDFFGKGFIGVSSDKCYAAGNERLAVVNLDVKKL